VTLAQDKCTSVKTFTQILPADRPSKYFLCVEIGKKKATTVKKKQEELQQ